MMDKNQLKNVFHQSKVESDILISVDGSDNIEYVGFAAPGTVEGAADWSIRKLSYDGSDNLVSVRYADGMATFNKVWTSRAGYAYI